MSSSEVAYRVMRRRLTSKIVATASGRPMPRVASSVTRPVSGARSATSTPGDEAGALLSAIRTALGLSEVELAKLLATSPRIVFALENGWSEALPEWPEIERIVVRWVGLAHMDPAPALIILEASLGNIRAPAAATSGDDRPRSPMPLRRRIWAFARGGRGLEKRRELPRMVSARRAARLALAVGVLVALGTASTQTAVVAAAVASLPAPAERAVRSLSDYLAVKFAPLRQGHRWIEVADPRSRRGDKLRTRRHSD